MTQSQRVPAQTTVLVSKREEDVTKVTSVAFSPPKQKTVFGSSDKSTASQSVWITTATRRFSTTKYTKGGQNVQTTVQTNPPGQRRLCPPSRTPINVWCKVRKAAMSKKNQGTYDLLKGSWGDKVGARYHDSKNHVL